MLVAAFNMHRIVPAVMEQLNRGKVDRASIEGQQYERMDARMRRLEESEEECQRQLLDALRRIAELEGYNLGKGQAAQEAAMIVAAERVAEAARKKEGGK